MASDIIVTPTPVEPADFCCNILDCLFSSTCPFSSPVQANSEDVIFCSILVSNALQIKTHCRAEHEIQECLAFIRAFSVFLNHSHSLHRFPAILSSPKYCRIEEITHHPEPETSEVWQKLHLLKPMRKLLTRREAQFWVSLNCFS